MSADADQRIAVLESEIRALKILLGTQQRTLTAPPRRAEPQVRITHPVRPVSLPLADEYRRLRAIVFDRYPQLAPRADEHPDDAAAQFRAAFQFLAHTGRAEKLDRDHGLSWWSDTARVWLQEHKIAPGVLGISGTAFVAAAIASGDILFTSLDEFPHISFGLVPHGGGLPSRDFWKRVLSGTLLNPLPPLHPTAAPSPARARQADGL